MNSELAVWEEGSNFEIRYVQGSGRGLSTHASFGANAEVNWLNAEVT